MIRIAGNAKGFPATTEPCAEAERRRRHVRAGETETASRRVREVGDAATPIAGGEAASRGAAIPVVSRSEGRTPRARPDESSGETVTGARRRSRQERQGRTRTRRRQLRERWLVTTGCAEGETDLVKAVDTGGRCRGHPGDTLKRGQSPRKDSQAGNGLRPPPETREVDEPRGGLAEPMRR